MTKEKAIVKNSKTGKIGEFTKEVEGIFSNFVKEKNLEIGEDKIANFSEYFVYNTILQDIMGDVTYKKILENNNEEECFNEMSNFIQKKMVEFLQVVWQEAIDEKEEPSRLKVNSSLCGSVLKQVIPNISKADRIKNSLIECNKDITYDTIQGFIYQRAGSKVELKHSESIKNLNDIKSLNKGQSGKFDKFYNFLMNCYGQTDTTKTQGYVLIPYELYLKYTGRSTSPRMIKEAKREIKDFMEVLMSIDIIAKIKGKTNLDEVQCKPFTSCDRAKYKNYAEIGIGQKFIDLIGQGFYSTPFSIGKLTENAFKIADFIYYHWRINTKEVGKSYNIKLQTIYEKTNLPSFETVKNSYDRHYDTKIYEPLDKLIQEIRESLKGEIEIGEFRSPENLKDMKQNIEIKVFNIEDYTETKKTTEKHKQKAEQIKEKKMLNKINEGL